MREKLERLLNNSYAKYSNYHVACICVMNDDKEINGVNVENISYGATICAERVAITSAIAKGYKKGDFKELHVMGSGEDYAMPCFMCRQVISEFFSGNCKIFVYSKTDVKVYEAKELCPYPFFEENL